MAENIEQWKLIDGYNNYEVSSFGRVRNNKTSRILKPALNNVGYYQICLHENNTEKMVLINRIVADAFCEKCDECNFCDHIDRNPKNNHFTNLRWVTRSGNQRNREMQKNKKLKVKGVYQVNNSFMTSINNNDGKQITKMFNNIEDAKLWRYEQEEKYGYTSSRPKPLPTNVKIKQKQNGEYIVMFNLNNKKYQKTVKSIDEYKK